MGKGLEFSVLIELLFYVSATLIPLALPLAILFSSIMTFGNLAEHNELTALKSSGQSLFKIMRPMLVFVIFLSVGAFYFTNYTLPVANLKWRTIIVSIQEKKPTFGITEGRFYNDIKGYSIKVDKKNDNTGELEGVLIYENNSNKSRTIKAERGEMLKAQDTSFLLLRLERGVMYEATSFARGKRAKYPYQKSFFSEAIFKFNLDEFKLQKNDEDLFKREHEMLNFVQLGVAIDSFEIRKDTIENILKNRLRSNIAILNPNFQPLPHEDSVLLQNLTNAEIVPIDTIIHLDSINQSDMTNALVNTQSSFRTMKDLISAQSMLTKGTEQNLNQYKSSWHQKFTLSLAVIILFFIGAPLGAIIKKGGLGAPLVFATLFFLLYYILTITGENMVETQVVEPWKGMWLSSFFLAPLGVFLTYKAANDSALFDRDVYKRYFRRILGKK